MGANNSTRRVSFESDENENITVVKDIRLSENVINRMKEPASPSKHKIDPSTSPSKSPTVSPSPPVLQAVPPLSEPITSFPPSPPVVEPIASPAPPPPSPSATETVAAPPPPPPQQVAAPVITEMGLPSLSANSVTASAFKPVAAPSPPVVDPVSLTKSLPLTTSLATNNPLMELITPLVPSSDEPRAASSVAPSSLAEPIPPPTAHPITKSDLLPTPSLTEPVTNLSPPPRPSGDSLSPPTSDPFAAPTLPDFTAPSEQIAPPSQAPVSSPPLSKPVAVPQTIPVTPPAKPTVDEEALRKKITDELCEGLEHERAKADKELQAWLHAEKAHASAQARAEAQSQVQDEVSRILSVERTLERESIQQAVIRERIATEDERLRAQLYAKQLEAREADLRKQDTYYREQMSRLEERSAQFYKVTTENYHKAADQVNAKFKRYEVYPVCADLQGQILECYKENVGKTLHCSNIATLYLQCVNNAKQNKLRTGG